MPIHMSICNVLQFHSHQLSNDVSHSGVHLVLELNSPFNNIVCILVTIVTHNLSPKWFPLQSKSCGHVDSIIVDQSTKCGKD